MIAVLPDTKTTTEAALLAGQILASLLALNPEHLEKLIKDEDFRYKTEVRILLEAREKITDLRSITTGTSVKFKPGHY